MAGTVHNSRCVYPPYQSQGLGEWKIRLENHCMKYIFQAMYPNVCFFFLRSIVRFVLRVA